jgi:flagellar hook-basal body complex protein FliE
MAIDALTQALAPQVAIPGMRPVEGGSGSGVGAGEGAGEGAGFVDSIGRLLTAADTANRSANNAVAGMLDGSADVHDAMIALQHADLTLQLTVQVRNKLVQAYQEIMRMPI